MEESPDSIAGFRNWYRLRRRLAGEVAGYIRVMKWSAFTTGGSALRQLRQQTRQIRHSCPTGGWNRVWINQSIIIGLQRFTLFTRLLPETPSRNSLQYLVTQSLTPRRRCLTSVLASTHKPRFQLRCTYAGNRDRWSTRCILAASDYFFSLKEYGSISISIYSI
jgi:hypothetical protein